MFMQIMRNLRFCLKFDTWIQVLFPCLFGTSGSHDECTPTSQLIIRFLAILI